MFEAVPEYLFRTVRSLPIQADGHRKQNSTSIVTPSGGALTLNA